MIFEPEPANDLVPEPSARQALGRRLAVVATGAVLALGVGGVAYAATADTPAPSTTTPDGTTTAPDDSATVPDDSTKGRADELCEERGGEGSASSSGDT